MTPRLQPLLPPPARSHAMPSRREFIEGAALAAAGLALPAIAEGRANQTPAPPATTTPAPSSATPPARIMPWYFALGVAGATHAYGVRTGCAAFCSWRVDPHGISLWADVRSGSAAVTLGERTLDVCDVVCRAGRPGESSFAALRAF